MKCMIWKDTDFTGENIKRTADEILANDERIHLLEPSETLHLHQAIDLLAAVDDIDNMMLTRLRFACNLHFELPAELRVSAKMGAGAPLGDVKSLAELLEMLPEDEANDAVSDVRIVINDLMQDEQTEEEAQKTKDIVKRMSAELFQQFVFLNLNMDITSKREIQLTIVKERFRKEYPKLRENLTAALDAVGAVIDEGRFSPEGWKEANEMREALQQIEEELEKARKRPIRIAAMGTKKAGKSVIINTLLKQEYAPTSSELPTPNIIKYVPEAPGSKLRLEYKEEKEEREEREGEDGKEGKEFESPEELRAYIEKEFKEAQQHTGDGSGLEDMVIHYPTEGMRGFEIYDTPGPNFAGAKKKHENEEKNEHKRIAKSCIERADVCIFVMNYSSHLTDNEVEFLQEIHEFFKSKGKFYSLLIAVNRIDERYSAEVEKSVTRVVDYIRKRLDDLEYPNIVTFGTSALQSFYLEKVRQLCSQGGENEGVVLDRDTIEDLAESDKGRKWMTQLDFLETSLRQLKRFHGYKKPTDSDLELMSGVPQLLRYVRYIGEKKADLEIVDHVVGVCEMKAKTVKNALEVTKFQDLIENDRDKIEELERVILELERKIKEILESGLEYVLEQMAEGAAKQWLIENRKENEEKAGKLIADGIEARVERMKFSKAALDAIYGGSGLSGIESLQKETQESIQAINQEMGRTFQNGMEVYCGRLAEYFHREIEKKQAEIQAEKEKIDQELGEEGIVREMFRSFELPQFPIGIEFPTVNLGGIDGVFAPNQLHDHVAAVRKERKVKRSSWAIVNWFRDLWDGPIYEHEYNEDAFKKRLKESAIQKAREAMTEVFDKAMPKQEATMLDYIGELRKQCMAYRENYDENFKRYLNMVRLLLDDKESHKEAVQQDIATFTEMNRVTQPFFTLFGDIVAPAPKEV